MKMISIEIGDEEDDESDDDDLEDKGERQRKCHHFAGLYFGLGSWSDEVLNCVNYQ